MGQRVVSLLPSSTEIVCALGAGERLVGRSHECDYPPGVEELPACTETKLALDGTSYELDQRVKAIVQEGLSVYRVHAGVLNRLAPDVVITQSQCEVCAVTLSDVEAAVCQMVASRPQIVALAPNALDDVWQDMERVAAALDVPERGRSLVGDLQARAQAIAERAATAAERPTVACVEWVDPLMAAGNWMPTLVEMAGGRSLFGKAGRHSPWLAWEDVREADPDVIVVLPCGWGLARTRKALPSLLERPGWSTLSAVRSGRVFLADGHQYFNRPGPRLVESLEILAEMLHPELFHFGHEGREWEQLG